MMHAHARALWLFNQSRAHLLADQVRVADKEDEGGSNECQLCQGQEYKGGHAVPGSLDGQ